MSLQSGPHFRALFDAALQDYEQKTKVSLTKHPLAAKLQNIHSVESVVFLLQSEARTFGDFRGRDKIMKSIKNTVLTLCKLSTIAAFGDAVGLGFKPAEVIYTGLGVLLSETKGVTDSYDVLGDLFESIEHLLKRLDIYTMIPRTSASTMDEMVVKIMTELISALALATKEVKQGRLKKFGKKLFGEKDIEAVRRRIDQWPTDDRARATAEKILEAVYTLTQDLNGKASSDSVRVALEVLHRIASETNKSKRDGLQQDILRWLSPPDAWENQHIARESCHEATAVWFIQGDTFSEWKSSGPGSLLWVHGKPGAGKSVLCSKVIEDIDALRKQGLASLAFFYHDFREEQKRDLRGLLSSLLFQLCDQSDSYYDVLSVFYSTHRNGAQTASNDELVRCLKDALELPGQVPVFLILDALDECSNTSSIPSPRKKVLMLVEELIDLQHQNLRIWVTSRHETDIKAVLQPLTFRSISLHDERGQRVDIENYIKSVVNTSREMRRWRQEHRQLVIDVLTERADGMFRWVYCQLVYLQVCHPTNIRRALALLPESLDETYARTLREINKANWDLAHRLLQFVAVAFRPLHVEELVELLAFDFDARPIPTFHEDLRMEDPLDAVLCTCPSLLAIVDVGGSPVIQFSHFTVKEFLMSARLAEAEDKISCRYYISMIPAHTVAAQACLGILLHLDEDITKDSLRNFPLATYAAEHWVDHARFENVSKNVEDGMKQLFDPGQPHLAIWVWIYNPRWRSLRFKPDRRPLRPEGTALHYAALCGFYDIVKFLVGVQPDDVFSRGFDDKLTPLHLASERGHIEVVRLLVEHGADATTHDKYGRTVLHLALDWGHVEVARMLIERDMDVTVQDSYGRTALHLATFEGHVEVARLLVERGADATTQDKDGRTALHLALSRGHVGVARMLVEWGTDMMAQDEYGRTALHLASLRGQVEVACMLVERGADKTAQDIHGQTALDQASALRVALSQGHVEVARMLVERGADVTAQDERGRSALHLALSLGQVEIAYILVARGADVTAQDEHGRTPLHLALSRGQVEVARMLVAHGADATAQDKVGRTSLHLASSQGHVEVVRMLIEHGVDVTAQDLHGRTALHLASSRGDVEVARILVEHGADVEAQDKDGRTALHLASFKGHMEVARIFVDRGACLTDQDGEGRTALHLASIEGHAKVARMLIERGADTTIQDEEGRTALHLALYWGQVGVACMLVECGIEETVLDQDGLHCTWRWERDTRKSLAYLSSMSRHDGLGGGSTLLRVSSETS